MSCSPQTQLICLPACIPQLVFACLFIVHTRARHYSCSSALPRATTHNKPISKQTHTHPTNTCHTKYTITHIQPIPATPSTQSHTLTHTALAALPPLDAAFMSWPGLGGSSSRPPTRKGLAEAVELVGAGMCIRKHSSLSAGLLPDRAW